MSEQRESAPDRSTPTRSTPDRSTVVIVQARLGSTRLPAKVLADLEGRPVLARVLDRASRSTSVDRVVVATTWLDEDDAIEAWCHEHGWDVHRGHPSDLLDRYLQTARHWNATHVVRITSDCPMVDPDVVDHIVGALHRDPSLDYCSNTLEPRTFPRGIDVEAFTMEALERSNIADRDPGTREHVTPHMKSADGFNRHGVFHTVDLSPIRWTVDTPEDLEVLRLIFRAFDGADTFRWTDALDVWDRHPDWNGINGHIEQKPVIRLLDDDGRPISPVG